LYSNAIHQDNRLVELALSPVCTVALSHFYLSFQKWTRNEGKHQYYRRY